MEAVFFFFSKLASEVPLYQFHSVETKPCCTCIVKALIDEENLALTGTTDNPPGVHFPIRLRPCSADKTRTRLRPQLSCNFSSTPTMKTSVTGCHCDNAQAHAPLRA